MGKLLEIEFVHDYRSSFLVTAPYPSTKIKVEKYES